MLLTSLSAFFNLLFKTKSDPFKVFAILLAIAIKTKQRHDSQVRGKQLKKINSYWQISGIRNIKWLVGLNFNPKPKRIPVYVSTYLFSSF